VIANSQKTKQELVQHLGIPKERIRVVYLGTDPEEFAPLSDEERQQARSRFGMSEKDVVLGFVGALGWDRNKGFDVLLAACRRLLDEANLPLRILAAGGGALDFWRAETARFGLQDRVQLIGHTSNIREVLAAFDLLVSPTRYDAYGLAVHEAVCLGLPVIVARTAGVAERFPAELADFVLDDPNEAAALAQAIRCWHAQPETGRQRFDRFASELRVQIWKHMATEFVAQAKDNPLALQH
jgi:glycosyltransferase involved in cell wall biosynthesis